MPPPAVAIPTFQEGGDDDNNDRHFGGGIGGGGRKTKNISSSSSLPDLDAEYMPSKGNGKNVPRNNI